MNIYKTFEFTMHAVPMICIYDSRTETEESAKSSIDCGIMKDTVLFMSQSQYHSIFHSAAVEHICSQKQEKKRIPVLIGDILFYYDIGDTYAPEKCRIDTISLDTNGDIESLGITFFNSDDVESDFDVFVKDVCEKLYRDKNAILQHSPISDEM